jgi:Family of unknown function (DUF6283)
VVRAPYLLTKAGKVRHDVDGRDRRSCAGAGSHQRRKADVTERGTCPDCGRETALTKAGTVRRHGDPTPGVWPPRDCPGTGKAPKTPEGGQMMAATGDEATGDEAMGPPAPRPCDSCPYRRDVPSGVWAVEEYEKLRAFDKDTPYQPHGLFQCHQVDLHGDRRRMCAGWVGCHGEELLALRLALAEERIGVDTYRAAVAYQSPVPLFTSGGDAADHGQRDIMRPGADAAHAIAKVVRVRRDLPHGPR